jgi:hypothetical protein
LRTPDFERDGWCLEDGEEYHRAAPQTFEIPSLDIRSILRPGDLAKLIFKIAVEGDEPSFERMWVIVRERVPYGYLGVLDNDPSAIAENNEFWSGTELPFEYRHIIDAVPRDAKTIAIAIAPPRTPWRRV